jgi:predicted N-acetyltransferase YhbS
MNHGVSSQARGWDNGNFSDHLPMNPGQLLSCRPKASRHRAMKLSFATATESDAPELAALHAAVAEGLANRFGPGFGSSSPSERAILAKMRKPKFSRTLIARSHRRIVGTLRLHTMKPWAIDTAYFTAVKQPLYLTGMAVHPHLQRKGVGRPC